MDGEPEDCDMDDGGLDHDLVHQEAWEICRVRELAKACARLSGRLLPTALERAARRITRCAARLGGFPPEPEPLTPLEVDALRAALQEAMAATAFPHSGQPTQEGVAAVEQLAQQALDGIDLSAPPPPGPPGDGAGGPGGPGDSPWSGGVGGGGEEGISVELLVRAGSERIAALSSGLACLLCRCLSLRNCFAMLLLGRCLGCPELAEAGLMAAVANFPAAVREDRRHFLLLDDSSLLIITSNSNLQVTQELDVWQAIAEWVGHAWESRRVHLYDLLQAGVRLSHLDTLQLSQLQRHPLLQGGAGPETGPAAQLVGAAYSARILSNVHQSRSRQRGAAAAGAWADTAAALQQPVQLHPSQQQQQQQQPPGVQGPRPMLPVQQQQPSGVPQQLQQQQRPQPHAALQQLIGSLQARAAAAKAKQQQLLLQQQQQAAATREGLDRELSPPPRSPPPRAEDRATPGPAIALAVKQEPGSSGAAAGPCPSSTCMVPTTTHAASGPAASASAGLLSAQGMPGGLFGQQLLQQQRRPSPSPSSSPLQMRTPQAGEAGGGGGGGGGSADKRQLASMLAQAIAKAAAKQGLPRIQLGAGGQVVTPGAVQAALSVAQQQMASNPALQEMLREAKAAMAQADQQGQGQAAQPASQHQDQQQPQQQRQLHQQLQQLESPGHSSPQQQLPRLPPLAVPPSDPSPRSACPSANPTTSTPPLSSPSPSLAISPGLASQLPILLPGSHPHPQPPPGQATQSSPEPGRPPQPPPPPGAALAPQQLLQIAAAVQKAVRSGQPQPPHVRQQLHQLQAFISRQLAATTPGSQQQPLLLALQSTLAGAASTSPQERGQEGSSAAAPPQQQHYSQAGPGADLLPPPGQGSLQHSASAEQGASPGLPDQQQQHQQQEGAGQGRVGQQQDVTRGRGGAASPDGGTEVGGEEEGGRRRGGDATEVGGDAEPKRQRR